MSVLLQSLAAGFDPGRQEVATLRAARRAALDAALRDGLPNPRGERWRQTSLRALERRAFAPAADPGEACTVPTLEEIPSPRLVFVNGRHDPRASCLAALPDGIELQPLSRVLAASDPRDTSFLARRFDRADETFARLNAALATEGVVLRVQANVEAATPLHLVFVGAPVAGDLAWHLRHLIDLGAGARLCVVQHHLAAGEHAHLANSLMHVHLAQGARLDHTRLQRESAGATSINRSDAVLARDARYRRLDLEIGAGLSRHELNLRLDGDHARVDANGVLFANGRRHLDTQLRVDHVARDATCDLIWRQLADNRGRAVFHGGILIRGGADGSDARLSSKGLLLSDGAQIDAQPVLEIHADEVKAAHGATVGQLDSAAVFYLRSRGLSLAHARRLLTLAFCREPLTLIANPATRAAMTAVVDSAIASALA